MTDAAPATATQSPDTRRLSRVSDLAAAAILAVLAALLAAALPAGSTLRALATLPVLLVVPGYLLVEAAVPSVTRSQRALHALVGLGVSPPLVALLALATAIVPGGFHAPAIVAAVTLACLALAAVAWRRRLRMAASPPAASAPAA
jgi:uncharacterized membrane protein